MGLGNNISLANGAKWAMCYKTDQLYGIKTLQKIGEWRRLMQRACTRISAIAMPHMGTGIKNGPEA